MSRYNFKFFLEIKNTADTPIDKTISLVEKQNEKDMAMKTTTIEKRLGLLILHKLKTLLENKKKRILRIG